MLCSERTPHLHFTSAVKGSNHQPPTPNLGKKRGIDEVVILKLFILKLTDVVQMTYERYNYKLHFSEASVKVDGIITNGFRPWTLERLDLVGGSSWLLCWIIRRARGLGLFIFLPALFNHRREWDLGICARSKHGRGAPPVSSERLACCASSPWRN